MSTDESQSDCILVVEDEFLIRMTLVEALTDAGYTVLEADTGDEAMRLLQQGKRIDLLMTDIQVPGSMDGLSLARAAREMHAMLPVIYMSGRPDAMRRDASSGGAPDAFIAKPYLPSKICEAARQMLRR